MAWKFCLVKGVGTVDMRTGPLKIFKDIGELLTLRRANEAGGRKVEEVDLSIVKDAVLVCEAGRVAWVGPSAMFTQAIQQQWAGIEAAEFISLGGRDVVPGFIECHTHLVFAGSRAQEFEWRIRGQSYQEIAAKGGGILSTVKSTRSAPTEELRSTAQRRAEKFLHQGVTTLEVKSGYGLDLETELRCLKVAKSLKGPRIITTYLGPHSRSPDVPDFDNYMKMVCEDVLPRLSGLADRVDIYVEQGFFSVAQAKTYLSAARRLGFQLTAHVEQLSDFGGGLAALPFKPQSLDHLVFASDELIDALAQSETTAVLLPASDLYLRMQYPRARRMIDSGVRVAISTDFNPGTSPTQDLSLVGCLSRLEMRMTLPEVIGAFTIGAAHALGLQAEVGSLTVGKCADFCAVEGSWRDLFYSVGDHPIQAVYKMAEPIELSYSSSTP